VAHQRDFGPEDWSFHTEELYAELYERQLSVVKEPSFPATPSVLHALMQPWLVVSAPHEPRNSLPRQIKSLSAIILMLGKILSEPEYYPTKEAEFITGLHDICVKREQFWMDTLKREASPQLFT